MGLKNDRVTNHNTITMKIKHVLAFHIYFFSIRQDSLIDDTHTHTHTHTQTPLHQLEFGRSAPAGVGLLGLLTYLSDGRCPLRLPFMPPTLKIFGRLVFIKRIVFYPDIDEIFRSFAKFL